MMDIQKKLQLFLTDVGVNNKIILVGVSAGADSTCLLHALIKCGFQGSIHVVYIDHNWRKESKTEAVFVRELALSYGLNFHLGSIDDVDPSTSSNLEEMFRDRRLAIFEKLYKELGASALLLAHHKDDQAETVFKRIFEGASIRKLSGLAPISFYNSMMVLRPFLMISKEEILRYLEQRNYSFFHDSTNDDEYYLRARMRKSIFPEIQKKFGKNATNNLALLGDKMSSLSDYLKRQTDKYFKQLCCGPFGSYLDLELIEEIEPIELECFIRYFLEKKNKQISQAALSTLIRIVIKKETGKSVFANDLEIRYEHQKLFFINQQPKSISYEIKLDKLPFTFDIEGYQFMINKCSSLSNQDSWGAFWKGEVSFSLPVDKFSIRFAKRDEIFMGKILKNRYLEEKVPSFFRSWVFGFYHLENLIFHPLLIPPSLTDKKNFKLKINKLADIDTQLVEKNLGRALF